MKKFNGAIFLCLFSVAIYFLLRLSNLNSIPVFVDEGIYVRWSQVMKAEATLRFLPLSDGKQPLFMWLTMPALKFISDPLVAGRLVSVAAGFISLIGIGFLTLQVSGSLLVGGLAMLIYSTVPFTFFFDRMALADSLLAAFGVWVMGLSVLYAKKPRLDTAMFLGFALGGGLITKSPAIFFYLWSFLIILFFINKGVLKGSLKQIVIHGFAALVISQVIYSVLRLGPGFGMINSRNQDYVFSFSEVLTHPLNPLVGNLKSTANWIYLLLTPTIIVNIAVAHFSKKNLKTSLFFVLLSLIPLIAQGSIAKVYTSRYILFATMPLLVVAAQGLYFLSTRKGLLVKLISPLTLIVPLYVTINYLISPSTAPMSRDMRSGYLEEWTAGFGQVQVADYLKNQEAKGEKVVVFTEGYFGTLPDGLQIYTEGHKNITIVGSPPRVDKIPEGLLNTAKSNKRYLVLNKSRNFMPEPVLSKLTLVAEFPKAIRPDGTREYLQFFELK